MLGIYVYMFSIFIVFAFLTFALVRRLFSAVFVYLSIAFYILFSGALFLAFDVPGRISDKYAYLLNLDNTLMLQSLIIAVFFFFFAAGYLGFAKTNPLTGFFPRIDNRRSDFLMITGVVLTSIGSILVAGFALAQGGNIAAAVHLVRHENLFSEFAFFKLFIRMGSLLTCAYALDLMHRRKKLRQAISSSSIIFVILLFSVNILAGLIMGGKTFVIFPIFIFSAGYALLLAKNPVRSFIVPVLVIIALAVSLQYLRVALVKGINFEADSQIFISLGAGNVDTNLIFLAHMVDVDQTSTGEDFYNGALGVIPRFMWSEKPEYIDPGGRFKDSVVSPQKTGAWPVFGFNLWLSNFGWLGVIFGGVLSGMMLAAIGGQYRDYRENAYSVCFMMFYVIFLLIPGGVDSLFFVKYISVVVPVFIFKWLSNRALLHMPGQDTSRYSVR